MMNEEYINIIFLGDIIGRPGRKAIEHYLSNIMDDADFIVANVENASHGFGLTEKNYNELSALGIDAFTSGNHIWDKKDIFNYIDRADKLIRPINYPEDVPGVGSRIFEKNGVKIGVLNVLGRVFMTPIDNPWPLITKEIENIQKKTSIILLDFHAEATAEKISLAYYVDKLGVSAVVGTHTHVQTADEKILNNGAAFISDVGYCGAYDSIIGMDIDSSLKRLVTSLPVRFDVAPMGKSEINGVKIEVNVKTGKARKIKRLKEFVELAEN